MIFGCLIVVGLLLGKTHWQLDVAWGCFLSLICLPWLCCGFVRLLALWRGVYDNTAGGVVVMFAERIFDVCFKLCTGI